MKKTESDDFKLDKTTKTILLTLLAVIILCILAVIIFQSKDLLWTANFLIHKEDFNTNFSNELFSFKYPANWEREKEYSLPFVIIQQQYVENSAQGKVFIVRDAFSEMVSMVNESGKMFACYMVGDPKLKNKLQNKEWTRLPKIPPCIPII